MFGKNWVVQILAEGEKSAQLISRKEKIPDVDPRFDGYPAEVKLPKRNLKQAIQKAIEYSKLNIYTMFYKDKRTEEQTKGEA